MLQDDVIFSCVTYLNALHKDLTKRFEDLLNLQIPQWITNPYNITAMEEANVITLLSPLWNIAEKYLIALTSSYLVEKGFSMVTNILTKQRNRLKINERGDLRLKRTNIETDLARLVSCTSNSFAITDLESALEELLQNLS
ncbi:unnamed protein product [Euphydryas editha]|uniref:Transposase n=1 Tax=Euphydryas editha TaxID=104508 RepID=A0AAU9UIL9_EUPED|nr:unnamed protein product [Euphydryas editha]